MALLKFDSRVLSHPTSNSRVIVKNWFAIDELGKAMVHDRTFALQCNPNKALLEKIYPNYNHVFFDVAFFDERMVREMMRGKS